MIGFNALITKDINSTLGVSQIAQQVEKSTWVVIANFLNSLVKLSTLFMALWALSHYTGDTLIGTELACLVVMVFCAS